MLALFIGAWCVGVGAWFYGFRFFFPMWLAGFRKRDQHNGYVKKAFTGFGMFLASAGVAAAASFIAEYWGGGWR